MSDMTCRTCAIWIRDPIESSSCGTGYGACHASLCGGVYKLTCGDHECTDPMQYEKLTDSIDKVALDMLRFINDKDFFASAPFALRLFGLGVRVDE